MSTEIIPIDRIAQSIYLLRGQKVMLGQDLASLYGVTVGALTQAMKRNANRFPKDFMFQLNAQEFANLKSQIVISSWGGLRSRPYAFTEQGVAMLSSVLKSERAVKVNIAIMRASGERTRLACWRWRPRHRKLPPHRGGPVCTFRLKKNFSASRRKEHAGRVRSPIQR